MKRTVLIIAALLTAAASQAGPAKVPIFDFAEATTNAAKGDTEWQYKLGVAYLKGINAPVDPVKAAELLKLAAEKGHAKAQANLGALYVDGKGVQPDLKQAHLWLARSAAQNDPVAQTNLGWLYFNGLGVEKDIATALSWYEKAATQGQIEGMMRLCDYYIKPPDSGEPQPGKAVKWLKTAAELGHPSALNSLGVFYLEGLGGVNRDYAEAMRLFKAAAEKGEPRAKVNVGLLYDEGLGVPRNAKEAAFWFLLSKEKDEFLAKKNLDDLVSRGRLKVEELDEVKKRVADYKAAQSAENAQGE